MDIWNDSVLLIEYELVNNDVNPRDYCGQFWLDSLVHDEETLKTIVNLVGSNRVIMGSDYPFPLGEHQPGGLGLRR